MSSRVVRISSSVLFLACLFFATYVVFSAVGTALPTVTPSQLPRPRRCCPQPAYTQSYLYVHSLGHWFRSSSARRGQTVRFILLVQAHVVGSQILSGTVLLHSILPYDGATRLGPPILRLPLKRNFASTKSVQYSVTVLLPQTQPTGSILAQFLLPTYHPSVESHLPFTITR